MVKAKNYLIKNKFKVVVVLIFIILFLLWMFFNLKVNKNFLKASLYDLMTIFFLVFVSYFLVEKHNDVQKKREVISIILDEIQTSSSVLENLCNQDKYSSDLFMMEIRKVKNNCNLLKEACLFFRIEEAVNYLKREIDELHTYVSEQKKISVNNPTIKRHCKNISYKSKEIYTDIYFRN